MGLEVVGGGGGGGGGGWHCERNLIKRSLLSGISGVHLLLESLGILIIILILRSNPFKHCMIRDALPRTGEGELARIWLEVYFKTFQTCTLFQTKQRNFPAIF